MMTKAQREMLRYVRENNTPEQLRQMDDAFAEYDRKMIERSEMLYQSMLREQEVRNDD